MLLCGLLLKDTVLGGFVWEEGAVIREQSRHNPNFMRLLLFSVMKAILITVTQNRFYSWITALEPQSAEPDWLDSCLNTTHHDSTPTKGGIFHQLQGKCISNRPNLLHPEHSPYILLIVYSKKPKVTHYSSNFSTLMRLYVIRV